MTGSTISLRSGVPWFQALLLVIAVGCLVATLAFQELGYALFAILPLLIAASLWLVRPRRFHALVTDVGIEVHEPVRETIAFHEIVAVNVWGLPYPADCDRIPNGPVSIVHQRGVLEVPEQVDVRSSELVRFLHEKFIPPWNRTVHPLLEDYLHAQELRHGVERVWTFSQRAFHGRRLRNPRPLAVSLAVFATGLLWIAVGSSPGGRYEGWLNGGTLLSMLTAPFVILFAISYFARTPAFKKKDYSLVVGPDGMALVQGAVRGQMRWDELQSAKLRLKVKGLVVDGSQNQPGIVLTFAGATVTIADVYDHPLPYIEAIILQYWRGE